MTAEMTPEQVVEMGKTWGEHFISRLTVEDVLNHFKPADILDKLEPAEIEAYLKKRQQQEKRSPKKSN